MKDLLSLTKRENCFYTVDGRTLCTIKELHEYLNNCNPESYYYHVSNGRNDFATWIRDVLLFNDLSKALFSTNNYEDAKTEVSKFTQNFDLHTLTDTKENSFLTYDDYVLKNLQELYYYIINCSDEVYSQHVSNSKNDFAKWIGDVFMLPELSQKIYLSQNKLSTISILRDFLINGTNTEEYSKYLRALSKIELMNEDLVSSSSTNLDNGSSINSVNSVNSVTSNGVSSSNSNLPGSVVNISKPISNVQSISENSTISVESTEKINLNSDKENLDINKTIHNTVNGKNVVDGIQDLAYTKKTSKNVSDSSDSNDISKNIQDVSKNSVSQNPATDASKNNPKSETDSEEKIQLKPLALNEDEEEDSSSSQSGPLLDPSKFHSFSDEELEMFSKFSKREKEIEEPSIKIEYLKTVYNELHSMIQDLRRSEKDALIAELMLRSINPKIDYYSITKNIEDYNHIIRIMKDVQKEIEEASTIQQHNLAEDIFKELRLQGIAMKKASTTN